jgi:hypothetical protein
LGWWSNLTNVLQRGWNHQPVSRDIICNFSRESPAHRSPAKGIWHDDNPPFEMQPVAWQVGIGTHRHPLPRPAFDLRKCWHMLAPFSHLQPCCCNFLRSSTWTNNIGFWLVLHRWRMRNCYLKFDRTLDSLSVGFMAIDRTQVASNIPWFFLDSVVFSGLIHAWLIHLKWKSSCFQGPPLKVSHHSSTLVWIEPTWATWAPAAQDRSPFPSGLLCCLAFIAVLLVFPLLFQGWTRPPKWRTMLDGGVEKWAEKLPGKKR